MKQKAKAKPSVTATLSIAADPVNPHADQLRERADTLSTLLGSMGVQVEALDCMVEDLSSQIDYLSQAQTLLNGTKGLEVTRLATIHDALARVEGTRDDPFCCYELADKIEKIKDPALRAKFDYMETTIFTRIIADAIKKCDKVDDYLAETLDELSHINGRDFDGGAPMSFPFEELDCQLDLEFLASARKPRPLVPAEPTC